MGHKTVDRVEDVFVPEGATGHEIEARLRFTIYEEDWAGVDVECHEACAWGADKAPVFANDFCGGDDPVAEARLFAGWIKWDGCSHLNFGAGPEKERTDGYLHLCGRESFDLLARCLIDCWNHARRLTSSDYMRETFGLAGECAH